MLSIRAFAVTHTDMVSPSTGYALHHPWDSPIPSSPDAWKACFDTKGCRNIIRENNGKFRLRRAFDVDGLHRNAAYRTYPFRCLRTGNADGDPCPLAADAMLECCRLNGGISFRMPSRMVA